MAMEWRDSYNTGDKRIDGQHKNLFEYINRLEGLIETGQAGGAIDRIEVENLLGFLDSYVYTHFTYEELCMTQRRCPVAAQNKEAHNRFLKMFEDFNQQCAQHGANLQMLTDLHRTLTYWLTNHICRIDVSLRA